MSHFTRGNVILMESEHHNRDLFVSSYDKYADAIFRYCFFRVFDRERAKELMQETFMKTWEYSIKGKQIENIRAFLYKVAHNLCVNEIRRPRQYSLDEMNEFMNFDPADIRTSSPSQVAEASLLIRKMQLLRPEERDLLTMRYLSDLPVSEIANLLQMLPNTVSVKLKRAEVALKKLYNENYDDQ